MFPGATVFLQDNGTHPAEYPWSKVLGQEAKGSLGVWRGLQFWTVLLVSLFSPQFEKGPEHLYVTPLLKSSVTPHDFIILL